MVKETGEKIDVLIQNSIALQKAITILAVNLEKFTKETGKLLEFMSDSAKSFEAEEKVKGTVVGTTVSGDLVKKLDMLIDQNKMVAKGLVLLENYLREKIESGSKSEFKL
jgi:hypothetical protein